MASKNANPKKKFLALTSALETSVAYGSKYDLLIDAAVQLRGILQEDGISLSSADKVRLLKSVTRAKVRALMGGSDDSYNAFRTLDGISTDMMKLI